MSEYQSSDEESNEIRWTGEDCEEVGQSSGEENGENPRDYEENDQSSDDDWLGKERRCIVSDPAHPHNLSRVTGYKTTKHNCISCGRRSITWELSRNLHYYCTICQVEFHRECRKVPSKMIHPYHPQHPLTFTFLHKKTGRIVDTNFGEHYNFFFDIMPIGFHKTYETIANSSVMFDKCTWCGNDLKEWFYRCLICNFALDTHCATQINPSLTIQNPKSHHHSLSLFPRPLSFPCNACGLINLLEPSYACYECNYMVHQSCTDLPRVIKITRHPHRLSHTPYLPTKASTCRVCYKNVDIKYGQYSCNHGDCSYVAHSKCATQHDVWDKKELEWEPEESDETKDIAPYKKVGVGLIEHFCHQNHFLKLEKYDGKRDSRKKCQACMRSITSHDFYNCIECDYFLHEVCANLSRQLDHLLHIHSLVLNPHDCGYFTCSVCLRNSSGWTYICSKHDECNRNFYLDVNCSLNPECFNHESHVEHLLFAATGTQSGIKCRGCYNETYGYHLQCTICKFAICYKCSTIPNEIYYKFDEHPLSLCYGESGVDGKYWCEVCEERLDPNHWFYTNTKGCTTIHYECVFGNSYYMKTGLTFNYRNSKVEVVANGSSRPKCQGFRCYKRCLHPEYLKWYKPDVTKAARPISSGLCPPWFSKFDKVSAAVIQFICWKMVVADDGGNKASEASEASRDFLSEEGEKMVDKIFSPKENGR
ncbi:hypothetical protein EUTSA_v10002351mg [Eutrema salsugineum]|uniref:DC1 domain-containing protein n=1 Tax=Eutrema salsugineum TaxID=72664 RepID=V4L5Q1_EUTSA|nr:hypothetical protein EUTSA_v10002351mg [Eutrema salsugineum]